MHDVIRPLYSGEAFKYRHVGESKGWSPDFPVWLLCHRNGSSKMIYHDLFKDCQMPGFARGHKTHLAMAILVS